MEEIAALLLVLVAGTLSVGSSLLWATHLMGRSIPLRVRALVGLTLLLAFHLVTSLALLRLGLFGRVACFGELALVVASGVLLVRGAETRTALARDAAHLGEAWRSLRADTPARPLALALVALAATQLLRGVLTPPMDWDFLTYHGPRAVFWLQDSELWHAYQAVGVWEKHSHYLPLGDLTTAWALGLSWNDVAVAPTWFGIWLALAVSTYAMARSFEAPRAVSSWAALATAFVPSAYHHMTSGYVDNQVALVLVMGTALLQEAHTRKNALLAAAAGLSFCLAFASKQSGWPVALIGSVVCLWQLASLWSVAERRRTLLGLVGLALAVALAWPVALWMHKGNPLFPYAVNAFGIHLEGARGGLGQGVSRNMLTHFEMLRAMFFDGFLRHPTWHNNFGVGGLVLLVGATAFLRVRRLRDPGFLVAACGMAFYLWIILVRRVAVPGLDTGRYLLAAIPFAAVLLSGSRSRLAGPILIASAGLQLPYALPWRWGSVDWLPMLACLGTGLLVVAGLGTWARTHAYRWLLAAGMGLGVGLLPAAAMAPLLRFPYYAAAARNDLFASGPISFCPSSQAVRLWLELASAPSQRIAVSAGYHDIQTHWFVYPLLGRRFQHRLLHLPGGPYFPEEFRDFDRDAFAAAGGAWVDELHEEEIDAVYLMPPNPIELNFVRGFPDAFGKITEARGSFLIEVQ